MTGNVCSNREHDKAAEAAEKKNQTGILELKDTAAKMKDSLIPNLIDQKK